jgi:integrase
MGRLTRTTGERLKVNYPHVVADKDRHGNVRIYYRLKGKPKVRLWQTPGTPEFVADLEAAKVTDETAPVSPHAVLPGSLRDLCVAYFESAAFKILDDSTRRVRRGILEGICQSRTKANKERGTLPYARMQPGHVEAVRDEKIDLPSAANGRVKALRQLFKWAKKTKKVSANPAAEVEYFQTGGDGWHTWTVEEVRQYQERWPIGTRARLALDLLLYTGVRRSDGVRLGPPMERARTDAEGQRSEELHFTEVKDSKSRVKRRDEGPKHRELPILPVLRTTIDATVPTGLQTYLVTEYGKPFTSNGFGNKMRDWCDAAKLPHCSAHGLRKAGATFASERRHDAAAHVPLWLGQHQASRDLYEESKSQASYA